MNSEPGITLRGVVVRYGKTLALDHADLEARTGIVTGLVGPNGAGKTTALRLLSGLVHPDQGTVRVLGIDPTRNEIQARQLLSFLPDRPVLPTHLSVAELLRLRAGIFGLDSNTTSDRLEVISAQLDITTLLGRWCGALSHGQAQRVALAAAFLPNPRVLLVDEPMTALDLEAQIRVRKMLSQQASKGTAVLLTTHTISHVAALAGRILHLRAGRVVAEREGTKNVEELEQWLLEPYS